MEECNEEGEEEKPRLIEGTISQHVFELYSTYQDPRVLTFSATQAGTKNKPVLVVDFESSIWE